MLIKINLVANAILLKLVDYKMTEYKLTYLDITSLGEVSRYIFAYGGIKYEDIRISLDSYVKRDDYFKELKKELPFGLLPTLEFDGEVYSQSAAIARYLATKVGLYGNNPLENLRIDEAYDNINDLRHKCFVAHFGDPSLKPSLLAEIKSHFMPYYLSKFEKIVGERSGHFAIPRWNMADMLFSSYVYYCSTIVGENILQGYPNLQKLVADVEALPGISDYIKNRPNTAL